MADAKQVNDAAEAYRYGFPLVYDLKEVASGVEGGGSLPMQAPYNRFAYARRLLGPETRFVSPTTKPCTWSASATCARARWCCTCPTPATATGSS